MYSSSAFTVLKYTSSAVTVNIVANGGALTVKHVRLLSSDELAFGSYQPMTSLP
jgi:hypothetical protein